jgi:hypothetical protein
MFNEMQKKHMVQPKLLADALQRSFSHQLNNKHTNSNSIPMAFNMHLAFHLPDSFFHVKNFTKLDNSCLPYITT